MIDLIEAVDRYLSIDKAPSAEWLLEAAETLDVAAKIVRGYGRWRPEDLAFAAELCRKRAKVRKSREEDYGALLPRFSQPRKRNRQ